MRTGPILSRLASLRPEGSASCARERLRSAGGESTGILGTSLVSRRAGGSEGALPVLTAPMGASAMLHFAAPASPLAQP